MNCAATGSTNCTAAAGAAAVAAGSGYSRLGGISSYSAALKELVLLPLQLPELFAKWVTVPVRQAAVASAGAISVS